MTATGPSGKRRVLLFGAAVCKGEVRLDNCEVTSHPFPAKSDIPDLTGFELVILPYSPFWTNPSLPPHSAELERFDKWMVTATKAGTWFCILSYHDQIPAEGVDSAMQFLRERQTGYRWLAQFGIRPRTLSSPWTNAHVNRVEFEPFLRKWGASWMYFRTHGEKMGDTIATISLSNNEKVATAFALDLFHGKLLYIPCQTDPNKDEDTADAMTSLIDCVLNYQVKARGEVPTWASVPIFEEERSLRADRERLSGELESVDARLDRFTLSKHLLFESEYELQASVPKFVSEQLGIPTKQEEVYLEDFWLLDDTAKETAICEVKSFVKGFKKGGIYELYNHREARGKDEVFPAVLFANSNLNSCSWQDKSKPIDKHDTEVARDNHVLILRVEDMLYAWQAVKLGKLTHNELAELIHNAVGWLCFSPDGHHEIWPK